MRIIRYKEDYEAINGNTSLQVEVLGNDQTSENKKNKGGKRVKADGDQPSGKKNKDGWKAEETEEASEIQAE